MAAFQKDRDFQYSTASRVWLIPFTSWAGPVTDSFAGGNSAPLWPILEPASDASFSIAARCPASGRSAQKRGGVAEKRRTADCESWTQKRANWLRSQPPARHLDCCRCNTAAGVASRTRHEPFARPLSVEPIAPIKRHGTAIDTDSHRGMRPRRRIQLQLHRSRLFVPLIHEPLSELVAQHVELTLNHHMTVPEIDIHDIADVDRLLEQALQYQGVARQTDTVKPLPAPNFRSATIGWLKCVASTRTAWLSPRNAPSSCCSTVIGRIEATSASAPARGCRASVSAALPAIRRAW